MGYDAVADKSVWIQGGRSIGGGLPGVGMAVHDVSEPADVVVVEAEVRLVVEQINPRIRLLPSNQNEVVGLHQFGLEESGERQAQQRSHWTKRKYPLGGAEVAEGHQIVRVDVDEVVAPILADGQRFRLLHVLAIDVVGQRYGMSGEFFANAERGIG